MRRNEYDSPDSLDRRFQEALKDEISPDEALRFRTMFENAWERRSVWGRIVGKPFSFMLIVSLLIIGSLGAGYLLMDGKETGLIEEPPNLILMPGQSFVDRPELMALFPKIDHPCLISKGRTSEPTYMLHGYLADHNIQIVWEH